MAVTDYTWAVVEATSPTIAAEVQASPFDRTVNVGRQAHLGNGLIRPFRRDEKNDWAHAQGLALVKSSVGQVLGTHSDGPNFQGEMPWNTEFGSLLFTLRHMNNDDVVQELARLHTVEALERWEPRVILKRVDIARQQGPTDGETVLVITIVYDVIQENRAANNVVLPNVEQVFQVAV